MNKRLVGSIFLYDICNTLISIIALIIGSAYLISAEIETKKNKF